MPRQPEHQWAYPAQRRHVLGVERRRGHPDLVRHRAGPGEPAVFERDGRTWVVFGAYDRAIHFVDADTGQDIIPPFPTGDMIKGSVTIDPQGYPIVYSGSRDNYLRAIAFDRPQPTELWSLSADAVSPDACGTTTGTARRWCSATGCSRAARTASSTSSS